MLWKCYTQYASKFGKLSSGHRTWKGQFLLQSQRKAIQRMFKLPHNCTPLTLLWAIKLMLKTFQHRLQQYMNCELPNVQAGFRKDRETRDQIANICLDLWKSKRVPEKHLLLFIDYAKAFDCVDHNKTQKILKEMGIPENLTCLLRNL